MKNPAGSSSDHQRLADGAATRRYFRKFERIISHLHDVAARQRLGDGPLAKAQIEIVAIYLEMLANTFTALSYKHLMAHSVSNALPQQLEIDRRDSGFPVAREVMQMANDLAQIEQHLDGLPDQTVLKREMVEHILAERSFPRRLQFAMSQRIYFETLSDKPTFLPQNHPVAAWLRRDEEDDRRTFLVHWAVYDSQQNLPAVYLMVVEDSGRTPLPQDERRWPAAQSHLLAQSITGLKLMTIATGFDKDFADLHPKLLRRIHVGPMYSHAFTAQQGPLRDILAEAAGEPGLDWALAWTVETLVSVKTEKVSAGFFSEVEREIYEVDYYAQDDAESGASRIDRSLILPARPYQVLADRDPPGLKRVRKYVVGEQGTVLAEI
ncbi:MAG: hypothetical protein OEN23_05995 [Paracoccaceae bacterium]|nr:hypothetical protein [Paracoccaceae bacterium]